MPAARSLLSTGTSKISASVFHFSLPAVRTCPGRSPGVCEKLCYAKRGRFLHPQVQAKLKWAFEQSKRDDFVDRMCGELYRRGVLAMRWFVSGDCYSPAMALKMTEVVTRSPFCKFWLYTRSWRVPTIEPLLRAMAVLPNMVVYYSCDSETGLPEEVPDQVRLAYLQADSAEMIEDVDLVFRAHKLRKERVPLHLVDVVCPQETPKGKADGINCAVCAVCINKK